MVCGTADMTEKEKKVAGLTLVRDKFIVIDSQTRFVPHLVRTNTC